MFEKQPDDVLLKNYVEQNFLIGSNHVVVTQLRTEILQRMAISAKLVLLLSRAKGEIHHWVQLALRQRAELPNVDHLPCGPTTEAIRSSEQFMQELAEQLAVHATRGHWPSPSGNSP